MKFKSFAAAALVTAALAGPAFAVDTVTAKDPQGVLDALTQLGYQGGKISKLSSGRTEISIQVSGSPTYIDFYDCADDLTDCYTLLFVYAMDLKDGTTLEKANDWNAKEITGRVSLDRDRDPAIDLSLTTYDGIPVAVFEQNVKLWDKKVGQVKDYFDF